MTNSEIARKALESHKDVEFKVTEKNGRGEPTKIITEFMSMPPTHTEVTQLAKAWLDLEKYVEKILDGAEIEIIAGPQKSEGLAVSELCKRILKKMREEK